VKTAIGGRYTEVYVSGEIRTVPTVIWEAMQGPKPDNPSAFINNGCTLSPDYFFGKPMWASCVVHDYQTTGEASIPRREADTNFRANTEIELKAYGLFALLAKGVAWKRYVTVRRAGGWFYSGKGDPS
jgi:hypothetical protein